MDQKIKDFWNKLNSSITDLWKNNKIFLFVFGILIFIIKFRSIIIDLLISNSKKIVEETKKTDENLKNSEENYKKESEYFVDKAKKISEEKVEVKEDWYKNEK